MSKQQEDRRAKYCIDHMTPPPVYLQQVERNTYLKTMAPQMLAGTLQGRFLSMISRLLRPKRVLEIGTFTGYSALCLAEGLRPDGTLHSIEINPELQAIILQHWHLSPYKAQMQLHIGDALDIIPTISGNFDLVFIDAAKELYAKYYDLLIDKIPSGGVILVDNILWDDKVLEDRPDRETQSIMAFNKKVLNDTRLEVVPLPIRDGISIIRVK